MAAYAVRDDVLARAGRFSGVFSVAGKRPNLADLDAFLEDVSAIIDAEIRARGFDPASLTPELQRSLKDVNAWAVIVRALPEAAPGDDEIEPIVEQGRGILEAAGFPSLAASGSTDVFAALEALEAGEGGGGVGAVAGSYVGDLEVEDDLEFEDLEASLPLWRRGQSL